MHLADDGPRGPAEGAVGGVETTTVSPNLLGQDHRRRPRPTNLGCNLCIHKGLVVWDYAGEQGISPKQQEQGRFGMTSQSSVPRLGPPRAGPKQVGCVLNCEQTVRATLPSQHPLGGEFLNDDPPP